MSGFGGGFRITYSLCNHEPKHEYNQRAACVRLTMEDRKKKAASGKRVRHVYPSGEVSHIWAHQVVDWGKNSCGTLFFRGPVIFSFGEHFPAARLIERKGKQIVLVSNRKSSITTSGHMGSIRSAISHLPQFEVRNVSGVVRDSGRFGGGWFTDSEPDADAHAANVADLVKQLEEQVASIGRARSSWAKKWKTRSARETRNNLVGYAKFFRLKLPKLVAVPKLSGSQLAKLDRHQKALDATREQRSIERNAKIIESWKRGNNVQLPGGRHRWRNPLPIMLRVRTFGADESAQGQVGRVEVSNGAQVPLTDAYALLQTVRKVRARGEDFTPKGMHQIRIGNYSVSKISATDEVDTLVAGCTHISLAEIDRVAPQVEAIFANPDGIAWG